MTRLVLDPWVLALCDSGDSDSYVDCLTSILDAFQARTCTIEVTDRAPELLEADGKFPLAAQLSPADWPNRRDIVRLVGILLDKLPKLERHRQSVVASEIQAAADLDCISGCVGRVDVLKDLMLFSMVFGERFGVKPPPLLSDALESGVSVKLVAAVELAEDLNPPVRIGGYTGAVEFYSGTKDFLATMDVVAVYRDLGIEASISFSLWMLSGAAGSWQREVAGWSVGPFFAASIGAVGASTNEARLRAVVRACANVIRGEALQATHHLRTGPGGAAPQRTRAADNAKAWRADVDDELHLHYWKVGQVVELAAVVFHNDFGIP